MNRATEGQAMDKPIDIEALAASYEQAVDAMNGAALGRDAARAECERLRGEVDLLTAEVARAMGVNADWIPTSANINALPLPLRDYIHRLETQCDPAGDVQRLVVIEEQNRQLQSALNDEQLAHAACERECEAASKTIAALRASHEASEKECERLRGEAAIKIEMDRGADEVFAGMKRDIEFYIARLKSAEDRAAKLEECATVLRILYRQDNEIVTRAYKAIETLDAIAPAPAKREEAPTIPDSVHAPVLAFFDSDHDKANEWFRAFNPLLGMTPMDLIALGKVDRLKAFIETQLAENAPAMQGEPCGLCSVPAPVLANVGDGPKARWCIECVMSSRAAIADERDELWTFLRFVHERNWTLAQLEDRSQELIDEGASNTNHRNAEITQRMLAADTKARGLELELAAERARGERLKYLWQRLNEHAVSHFDFVIAVGAALECK